MTATHDDEVVDLRRANAELQRRLDEALAERDEFMQREIATAEVLQVINSSPGDLAPVFDAMLDKAIRLCESSFGALRRFDGKMFRAIAVRDASVGAEIAHEPVVPDPGSASERIAQGESVVHIPDLVNTEEYRSGVVSRLIAVEKLGARTALWVALRKDDVLVGDFVLYRKEVRPFSDKQIALLQNFAAQSVIAMENARLLTKTRAALEQQTATAEVLQVINSSPGDLAPVFDAMLEKAIRLCGGLYGILWTLEGQRAHLIASREVSPEVVEVLRQQGESGNHPLLRRVIAGERLFQFDLAVHDAYRLGQVTAARDIVAGGVRRVIWVAMVKDGAAVGAFAISRRERQPFSDKQIALLQNFAAQAVIAMENARLITETREALEQQTATAEVLQVINSSPGDLAPVFDAILDKAHSLCGAELGVLFTYDGERFWPAAAHGVPSEFDQILPRNAPMPDALVRKSVPARMIATRSIVHVPDLRDDESFHNDAPVEIAAVRAGIRTALYVPMIKEREVVGGFIMHRLEVRPFTDKQIALLQNFAAQAVIAIENARLLAETREALEQQTATAEVLQVINATPGNLVPVFDAMLDKALKLCEASFGSLRR